MHGHVGTATDEFHSTHLADLKALTHDLLYETYRTEKLSRTVHTDTQYVSVELDISCVG